MSVYMIFQREKMLDEAEFETYAKLVAPTMEGHPIKPLAFYGKQETLEGEGNDGAVIVEFPSKDAARAWYDSKTYRKVREHRFKAAKYNVTLVEGV